MTMAALTRRLLIFITLFWLATAVQAGSRSVSGLYDFEVPVADSRPSTRKTALREGLVQVLVRITGERMAAEDPRAQGLLQAAETYVQRFAYVQRPVAVPEPTDSLNAPLESEQTQAAQEMFLTGRFAERALNKAIRSAGMSLWSAERPILLAAVVVPTDDGLRLLDASAVEDYAELADTAKLRGLPLAWPEGLTADALHDADSPQLMAAASQADAEVVLWGRLFDRDGKWVLQAQLQSADAVLEAPLQSWRLRSREPGPLLREAMQRSVDWLAAQNALTAYVPGSESIVGLWVRGVDGEQQYREVENHLRQLPGIEQISLVAVVDGALVFRASTEAAAEQLDRSIRQAGKLEAEAQPPTAVSLPVWTGEYEYHYRAR